MAFFLKNPDTMLRALLLAAIALAASCSKRPPAFSLRIESKPESPGSIKAVVSCDDDDFFPSLPRDENGGIRGAGEAFQIRLNGEPLFSTISVRNSELDLSPAAPLAPGTRCSVRFDPAAFGVASASAEASAEGSGPVTGESRLVLMHRMPDARPAAAPRLVSIHPTAAELPANHLKFYLTFSQPMEQGVCLERIRLLRGDGSEIIGPFRETELWSPDGLRLTVWLHPGRQKTGVNLNEDEGPVLKEGDRHVLKVDGRWRAASGLPLGGDVEKAFRVAAAVHEKIEARQWGIHPPAATSREPLRITFPRPLDWALLRSMIIITDGHRRPVAGRIEIAEGECEWRFVPDAGWWPGDLRIQIDPLLEDLAGNNLARPFEVNVASESPVIKTGPIELSVSIR